MGLPLDEFDSTVPALIEPSAVLSAKDVPQACVVSFFGDVVEAVAAQRGARVVIRNSWEDGPHPVYEIEHHGTRLAFFQPGVGGPLAAGLLEEVIAWGCRKFVVCGGCGVLNGDLALGHLVVVDGAVRDEGTSYHYLPPAREVAAQPRPVSVLTDLLVERGLPHVTGKTWTTDAPYRETPGKVAARRAEGCLTVDMEAASLIAVARFREVELGQILYSGDDLSGESWEHRGWHTRTDIRTELFWLAADAAIRL